VLSSFGKIPVVSHLQFWDDRTPHAVRRIYGPHICGDALDIDGMHNHLITGSWRKDNVLQIWDMNTGNKIKDVPQDALHKCMVCLSFSRPELNSYQNLQNMNERGSHQPPTLARFSPGRHPTIDRPLTPCTRHPTSNPSSETKA